MSVPVAVWGSAAVVGMGLTVASMPIYLAWARKLGWGQEIRPEGPDDHKVKAGTPTMGGAVLLPAALAASVWAQSLSWDLVAFWCVTLLCGLLGLVDDLTAVTRKRNLGLKARHKLAIQGLVGAGLAAYLIYSRPQPGVDLPLVGFVPGAWLVVLVSLAVLLATTNAVNLTDGLDGLAAGTVATAALAYAVIAQQCGKPELGVVAVAISGACFGFLWYNCYPARVFMGDTGSLGLGGALAALALLTGTEFLLFVIGGVFVAEALSVIIQVAYFKSTGGKRIFRMSPLHHHFALGGLHEVQVTTRFWLVGALLAGLGTYLFLSGCAAA